MRILGQSGNRVFEQHYQDSFIGGLQSVVLLRPSQDALVREARKSRNRDPLAPTKLGDNQLQTIRRDPRVLALREERRKLMHEIRSSAGTVEVAKDLYPELHRKHKEVCKSLERERRTLRQETKRSTRERYYRTMPTVEVDKQIDHLLGNSDGQLDSEDDEDWNPPIPKYVFPERARIVDAFYGQEAETLEGEAALIRRIQVTKDMVALCRLWEPSRRGKRPSSTTKDDSNGEPKQEVGSDPGVDEMSYPTNICIVCQRKFPRIDSLRRHLISQHLKHLARRKNLRCTRKTCNNEKAFFNVRTFLRHAATVHSYDLNIRSHVLDRLANPIDEPAINDLGTDSTGNAVMDLMFDATRGLVMSSTKTPASSIESDCLDKIDPRLR